jgi:hypothetical protein
MENIKLVEKFKCIDCTDVEDMSENIINDIIDNDFTIDELIEYVENNNINIDIESIIAEIEYIMEMKDTLKKEFESIYEEELGRSHYHNDEGGEN